MQKKYRIALVVYVLLMTGLMGARDVLLGDESYMASRLVGLSISIAIVMWCVVDARIRRKPVLPIVQFLMLLTSPLSACVYLVWSRKGWGLLWILGGSITLLIVYGGANYAAWQWAWGEG